MAAPALPITPVGQEASADLAQLHAAAFEAPWSAEDLAGALASPFAFALQAGSPAVGFILARAVAGEGEIMTLAVEPTGRRQGAGLALVRGGGRRGAGGRRGDPVAGGGAGQHRSPGPVRRRRFRGGRPAAELLSPRDRPRERPDPVLPS